ncbi:hypothetical protein J2T50_000453 [Streptococcus gallinaceus]|uniref:Uncharacterized protein n=1 Tax=Streptococcus gallinaceus TaxID=165758 RepID=A0ABV2JJY5_9STRE|nr:hypothetical protein [Streptococcus gallinaceus]MCP1769153.1 hypothetical protein [Streptococcus gallinaceus]
MSTILLSSLAAVQVQADETANRDLVHFLNMRHLS